MVSKQIGMKGINWIFFFFFFKLGEITLSISGLYLVRVFNLWFNMLNSLEV